MLLLCGLVALAGAWGACSGSGQPAVDAWGGGGDLPDGYGPLQPCAEPGKPCDPRDPCAVKPICGPDLRCWPSWVRSCDDGHSCTEDSCLTGGGCSNVPRSGFCLLPVSSTAKPDGGDAAVKGPASVRCFKHQDRSPANACLMCKSPGGDGGASQATKWTVAAGEACDDGDSCTKDDKCTAGGACQGTSYKSACDDGYSCTADLCDGKGGCSTHLLQPGWCLIKEEEQCFADGAQVSGGCAKCDSATNPSGWTPTSKSHCIIHGDCYAAGMAIGCFTCSPTASQTSWTAGAGCTYLDLDIGEHAENYSVSAAYGFWFTAPVSFTIVGLRVPTEAGAEMQNIEVVRFVVEPPIFPLYTTGFKSLAYTNAQSGAGFFAVSIPVKAGDIIGVIGARGTATLNSSAAAVNFYDTTISGKAVRIKLLIGHQNLHDQQTEHMSMSYTAWSPKAGYPHGRVELRYTP